MGHVGVLENPSLSQVQLATINIHPIPGHLAQLMLSGDWTSEHEENYFDSRVMSVNGDFSPNYLGQSGSTMYTESQGLLRLWE